MNNRSPGKLYSFLFIIAFIPTLPFYAQKPRFENASVKNHFATKTELKVLFCSDEPLHLFLYIDDFRKLKRDTGNDPEWHTGTLIYYSEDSAEFDFNIKLQVRGHFRKEASSCSFPPLRINFREKEVEKTIFEGQDKLKLVTHCRTNSEDFEQYILKEYFAYCIYNILTERSFRVRLAEITYIDRKKRYKPVTRFGFFIEDTKDMAERNGFTHIKVNNIPQEYTDYFYQDLLSVFQYCIGNTDWSIPARHNIKLISEKPDLRPVPVPYDFDWSGIVNPVYAKPSEKLGINSVTERIFRGYEKNVEDYYRIFDLFQKHKEDIYALLDRCQLNEQHRKMVEQYLNDFYDVLSDEKRVYREFVSKARTPDSEYWGK